MVNSKNILTYLKWFTVLVTFIGLSSCSRFGDAKTLDVNQLQDAKKQAIDAAGGATNQAVGNINQAAAGAGGF